MFSKILLLIISSVYLIGASALVDHGDLTVAYEEATPAPFLRSYSSAINLVLASPLTMCDGVTGLPALNNMDEIVFGDNVDGLSHPAGPEASSIHQSFGAVMISQQDGNHLIQALSKSVSIRSHNL